MKIHNYLIHSFFVLLSLKTIFQAAGLYLYRNSNEDSRAAGFDFSIIWMGNVLFISGGSTSQITFTFMNADLQTIPSKNLKLVFK